MWLYGLLFLTILALAKSSAEADITIEAAFQGRCGSNSPCEQLCYELHDGMYECDCTEGYELHKNGYSCQELNTTYQMNGENNGNIDEDILYQRGASFSAKLDNSDQQKDNINNHLDDNEQSSIDGGETYSNELFTNNLNDKLTNHLINNNLNPAWMRKNSNDLKHVNNDNDDKNKLYQNIEASIERAINKNEQMYSDQQHQHQQQHQYDENETKMLLNDNEIQSDSSQSMMDNRKYYYPDDNDMSMYDDVNNNKLNLRNPSSSSSSSSVSLHTVEVEPTKVSSTVTTNQLDVGHNTNDKKLMKDQILSSTELPPLLATVKYNATTESIMHTTNSMASIKMGSIVPSPEPCLLDCGSDGICDDTDGVMRCQCPYSRMGEKCEKDASVIIPRFTNTSWIAYPAFRGAYKHVQLYIEFRPETYNGIILLTGERDDLTGDFMAVLIHQGFIEFWFDCGSGTGKVRSDETVVLNQWNSITVFRHRWDAWIMLNQGRRVQGRSKGLFSRITFREPVFLGGIGNVTGLAKRLPVSIGLMGCIRKFSANEHDYDFTITPLGDVANGFDIQECTADRCGRLPCQHGGKCLPSDQGAICLCPLGFGGDLCEMRLDLQVPSFNGSSYLQFTPLGDSALIWLELKIVLKPMQLDGLILYSGHHDYGDYIALSLNMGVVEFTFDLGSGAATVRSELPLMLGQWHTIHVSRTARLAVLKIDEYPEVMTISSNGFWHLLLPHSLYLGGVQNAEILPSNIRDKGSFTGCIQKLEINSHNLAIISEALGGSNIDNCPHACVARPCGDLATCIPSLDSYECKCSPTNDECNKSNEVSVIDFTKQYNEMAAKSLTHSTQSTIATTIVSSLEPTIQLDGVAIKPLEAERVNDSTATVLMTSEPIMDTYQQRKPTKESIKENETTRSSVTQSILSSEIVNSYDGNFNGYGEPNNAFNINGEMVRPKGLDSNNEIDDNNYNDYYEYDDDSANIGFTKQSDKDYESVDRPPPTSSPNDGINYTTVSSSTTSAVIVTTEPLPLDPTKPSPSLPPPPPLSSIETTTKSVVDSMMKIEQLLAPSVSSQSEENNSNEDDNSSSSTSDDDDDDDEDDDSYEYDDLDVDINDDKNSRVNKFIYMDDDLSSGLHGKYMYVDIAEMLREEAEAAAKAEEERTKQSKNNEIYAGIVYKDPSNIPYVKNKDNMDSFGDIDGHTNGDENEDGTVIGDGTANDEKNESKDKNQTGGDMVDRSTVKTKEMKFTDGIDDETNDRMLADETVKEVLPPMNFYPTDDDDVDDIQSTKIMIDDMERIMKNGDTVRRLRKGDTGNMKRDSDGACFTGTDSYFHYNDAETMRQVISYQIDLNLRFKTHTTNGLVLWTGRHSAQKDDDFLSLGIENGHLHFRYNLGSGPINIKYNASKVNDGLWHRVRAYRNLQEGSLQVDGSNVITRRSPGKLKQLNTDTGLYVGGMPEISYYTRRKYFMGIVGCISEIILAGEVRLSLDSDTLGTSHNVEPGIL